MKTIFRTVRRRGALLLAIAALLVALTGCGGGPTGLTTVDGVIQVVAAESFWGSIASQLGGTNVSVYVIVNDPNADPHEYEATAADSVAVADANYVIINGAGYDTWAQKLIDANPRSGRRLLNVADLLGKKQGDNPHFWYYADYVNQVADRISQDYAAVSPTNSAAFSTARHAFDDTLAPYRDLIASIRQTFSGVKIGATESVFVYMSDALGLDLTTPPAFMNAIAQESEPPAAAVAEFQRQINERQIEVLLYNDQTRSAITNNMRQLAERNAIPTVGISETLVPANATFQDWQVRQLTALRNALALRQ